MEYKASPKRPYLLRAYYDWLINNEFTPYLVVDATYPMAVSYTHLTLPTILLV